MANVQTLVDSYYKWLKDNTILNSVGDYTKITTPFIDRNNDCIQLYIKQLPNGDIYLTDDGYTIDDLELSGFLFNTKRRNELLKNILFNYHIKNEDGVLSTVSSIEQFPYKKHFFIQAILAINDLYNVNKSNVASLFFDDVSDLFDNNDMLYLSNIKISGRSGFDHTIDFTLPKVKSKNINEAFIKIVNSPNKSNTENILFTWSDIKNSRKDSSDMFVILNDNNTSVKKEWLNAFKSYDVCPLLWSKKNEIIDTLRRTG